MREEKEVMQEYLQTCADVGNIRFQIETLSEGEAKLMGKLHNLNLEIEKIRKTEQKKKSEEVALKVAQDAVVNHEG
jgi:hypothetical protein